MRHLTTRNIIIMSYRNNCRYDYYTVQILQLPCDSLVYSEDMVV